MYRMIIVVAGILAVTMVRSYNSALSHTAPIHGHGIGQVVSHDGATDSKGCHEDDSGGYHCH